MTEPAVKPTCILVLQGGGAMGAYHIGAFQALQEDGFEPDWVCGISMGSINGAIIAGNVAERRLERLDAFWARSPGHRPYQLWVARSSGPGNTI